MNEEGPMYAKRAYEVYLRSAGIMRLGRQLKRMMNSAMQVAINDGELEKTDEKEVGGLIHYVVRKKGDLGSLAQN